MLRFFLRTLLVLFSSFAVFACSSTPTSEAVRPEDLGEALLGEWVMTSIAGEPSLDQTEPFLGFSSDGRIYGSTGCNRMTGRWQLHGVRLQLDPMATTRMAGPPEVMEQERRILGVLGDDPVLGITGDRILLTGASGTQLLARRRAQ